jgi:hypothetical protein
MPADILNLRRARKAKARSEKERQAEENRVRHGQSKSTRQLRQGREEIESRRLEGHRRESQAPVVDPDVDDGDSRS